MLNLTRPAARRTLLRSGASLWVLAAIAGAGCEKKKPVEAATKDDVAPPKKAPKAVAAPETLLVELTMRDPDKAVKIVGDGAGLTSMIGESPTKTLLALVKDEDVKKALRSIDPHGGFAAIALGKISMSMKPHGVAAAQLKDTDLAEQVLASAAKSGDLKSWTSKPLGAKVYEAKGGKGELAIMGDTIVVSDTRDGLEEGGRYAVWLSTAVDRDGDVHAHDLYMAIPFSKIGGDAKSLLSMGTMMITPAMVGAKTQPPLNALLERWLGALGDLGDMTIVMDAKKDHVDFQQEFALSGASAALFAPTAVVDVKSLLAMPKGEASSLFRFDHALDAVLEAAVDDHVVSPSKLSAADQRDVMKSLVTIDKALEGDVVYTTRSGAAVVGGSPDTEILVRAAVTDAPGMTTAMPTLLRLLDRLIEPYAGKLKHTTTPFKADGATGQTHAYTIAKAGAAPTKVTFTWALRDGIAYFDFSTSAVSLLAPTLDASSAGRLESDTSATAFIGKFPKAHLAAASYGDAAAISRAYEPLRAMVGVAASPTGEPPIWSWRTVDAKSMLMKGALPNSIFGDFAVLGAMAAKGVAAYTSAAAGMSGR